MLNINIQFQTIHNDPNLVAHLAPEDRLALHLALLLSSVAALLDRLLAALASVRLATLLPRLVVARKACVCSTLARLHGAGNLLTLLSWHKAALLPRHRLAHR